MNKNNNFKFVSLDRVAVLVFVIILIAWVGAWNLKIFLDSYFDIFKLDWVGFTYWVVAKLIIWIIPAFWLIKRAGHSLREMFIISSWSKCLVWACGIGGLLALVNIIGRLINDIPILPDKISLAFVNIIIIAPIFEEFLMRGAILNAFQQKHSFLISNSVTALFFVLLHFPGWYYTGYLWINLLALTGGALSIFIIGWLCGFATNKGQSIIAGMIVHLLNNLT